MNIFLKKLSLACCLTAIGYTNIGQASLKEEKKEESIYNSSKLHHKTYYLGSALAELKNEILEQECKFDIQLNRKLVIDEKFETEKTLYLVIELLEFMKKNPLISFSTLETHKIEKTGATSIYPLSLLLLKQPQEEKLYKFYFHSEEKDTRNQQFIKVLEEMNIFLSYKRKDLEKIANINLNIDVSYNKINRFDFKEIKIKRGERVAASIKNMKEFPLQFPPEDSSMLEVNTEKNKNGITMQKDFNDFTENFNKEEHLTDNIYLMGRKKIKGIYLNIEGNSFQKEDLKNLEEYCNDRGYTLIGADKQQSFKRRRPKKSGRIL